MTGVLPEKWWPEIALMFSGLWGAVTRELDEFLPILFQVTLQNGAGHYEHFFSNDTQISSSLLV